MHIFIDHFNFWPSKKDDKFTQKKKLNAYDRALEVQADNVWRALGADGYIEILGVVNSNTGCSISFDKALTRYISNDVYTRISERDRWLFDPESGMGKRNLEFLHNYVEWVAEGILTGRIRRYSGWFGKASRLWKNQIESIRDLSKKLSDEGLADIEYDSEND